MGGKLGMFLVTSVQCGDVASESRASDFAVVGADPHQAPLDVGRRDGKGHLAVELAQEVNRLNGLRCRLPNMELSSLKSSLKQRTFRLTMLLAEHILTDKFNLRRIAPVRHLKFLRYKEVSPESYFIPGTPLLSLRTALHPEEHDVARSGCWCKVSFFQGVGL